MLGGFLCHSSRVCDERIGCWCCLAPPLIHSPACSVQSWFTSPRADWLVFQFRLDVSWSVGPWKDTYTLSRTGCACFFLQRLSVVAHPLLLFLPVYMCVWGGGLPWRAPSNSPHTSWNRLSAASLHRKRWHQFLWRWAERGHVHVLPLSSQTDAGHILWSPDKSINYSDHLLIKYQSWFQVVVDNKTFLSLWNPLRNIYHYFLKFSMK